MCGLFGIASSSLSREEIKIFNELALVSVTRGVDSAGLMAAYHSHKTPFTVRKYPINAYTFFHSKIIQDTITDNRPCVLAGHARAATQGAVNEANAHPYVVGKLIGMHNGTCFAFSPPKEDSETVTDSLLLYKSIEEIGLRETLKKARHGAFALVWFNTEDRTVNFIRNDKRPLFIAKTKSNCIVWASERRFIDFVETGSTISFEETYMLHANKHYSVKIGSCAVTLKNDYTDDLKEPFVAYTKMGATDSSRRFPSLPAWEKEIVNTGPSDEQILKDASSLVKKIVAKETSIIPFYKEAVYKGWNGKIFSMKEAQQMLRCGCSNCTGVSDPRDKVYWHSATEYICNGCKDAPIIVLYMPSNVFNESEYIEEAA